jgi:hypothetical protein
MRSGVNRGFWTEKHRWNGGICMQASPARQYGGSQALVVEEPAWRSAQDGERSRGLLDLLPGLYAFLEDYYDREHLTRAGDWMAALAPDAEHLIVAALTHDVERKVPGGPVLDIATTPWDDRDYNTAHTGRSAVVVPTLLLLEDAPAPWIEAVAQPIREHEFGGSPEGDLMQAADSISFLETNAPLVIGWAQSGRCSAEKAREKLRWMGERVRHEGGREIARAYMERALLEFDDAIGA